MCLLVYTMRLNVLQSLLMMERVQLPNDANNASPFATYVEPLPHDTSHAAISEPELIAFDAATAQELFTAHIDRVEEGDDITRVQRREPNAISAYIVGGALGEAGTTVWTDFLTLPYQVAGSALMAASVAAISSMQLLRRRTARKRFERNNGMPLLEQIGHAYEAYRIPKSPQDAELTTAIHWHGAIVPEGTLPHQYPSFLSSVRSITKLAEQAQVSKIVVDSKLLQKAMPECTVPEGGRLPAEQLLEATQLDIDGKVERRIGEAFDLVAFTPQAFRKYVESELGVAGIDSLVEQLAEAIHTDPMVALYQRLKNLNAPPEAIRTSLLRAVHNSLERNIEADPRMTTRLSTEDPTRTVARADVSCRITGDQVIVRRTTHTPEGQTVTTESCPISEALPLSDAQRQQFDRDAIGLTPHQKKLIIYERIYETTREAQPETGDGTADGLQPSVPIIASQDNLVQAAIVAHRLSPVKRSKQFENVTGSKTTIRLWQTTALCGFYAIAAGAGASFVHYTTIGSVTGDVLRKAEILNHQGVKPNSRQLFDEAWNARPVPAYRHIVDAEHNAVDSTAQFLAQVLADVVPKSWIDDDTGIIQSKEDQVKIDGYQGQGTLSNQQSSGVGNSNINSPNEVDWYLTPHNMDSAGYWGTKTYSLFINSGWENDRDTEDAMPRWTEKAPASIGEQHESYIAVRRTLAGNDLGEMALPVLQGTRPVAINLDGKRVNLEVGNDGSYVVDIREPGTLTYYVEKASSNTEGLRASRPAFLGKPEQEGATPAQMWHSVLPERSITPNVRTQQEMAYIRSKFTYSLTPEPKETSMYEGINRVTSNALLSKLANCNVAATILVADNVTLNYAEGWRNSNLKGEQQILSSHEAHAWAVNNQASIFDATPAASIENMQLRDYFDESKALPPKPAGAEAPILIGGVGLGLIGAAGVARFAYRRRKAIAKRLGQVSEGATALATAGANALADLPGTTRQHARGARNLMFMDPLQSTDTLRRAYTDAASVPGSLRDVSVTVDPRLDYRLSRIGVSYMTRLAIRARLGLRRYAQRSEYRTAERRQRIARRKLDRSA